LDGTGALSAISWSGASECRVGEAVLTEDRHQNGIGGKADDGEYHPPSDEPPDDKASDEGRDEAADGDEPLYRQPLFWIAGGIIAATLIIAGLLYWSHARQYQSTDDAFVDAHIVRIAPQVAGVLQWVAPADNRHVRAGQLLAVIAPSGRQAQKEQAQAEVAQAIAQVKQAEGQLAAAQAAHDRAIADAMSPEAQAAKVRRDLARYEQLARLDTAAVAATQLDQARSQATSASAQALAARRQVRSAEADIAVARRQIEAAQAQVAAAQARVRQADVTLGDLRLLAPVNGQVVNRTVNIGSYVAPGTQLMAIVPDHMWVTANFKETQLTHMAPGQHVDIRIDAFPGVRFEGHVDSIQRGAGQAFALLPPQNESGNYVKVVQRVPVRILFDRPDPRRWAIGPGMSVVPRVKVR
jgi:membrane fusion protein (multidrug efflux system)